MLSSRLKDSIPGRENTKKIKNQTPRLSLTMQVVLAHIPQILPGQGVQQTTRGTLGKDLQIQGDVTLQHPGEHLFLLVVKRNDKKNNNQRAN